MKIHQTVYVDCIFYRGGFAHERTFAIPAPGGGSYQGTAFIQYCCTNTGVLLREEEPPADQSMPGWLEARVLKLTDDLVTIWLPDGGVCDVRESILHESPTNVPV